jgi:hypothetical protein
MLDRRSLLAGIPFGTLLVIGGCTGTGRSITGEVHAAMQRFKEGWHALMPYGVLMRDLNETMSKLATDGLISGFTTELHEQWGPIQRMKCGSLVKFIQEPREVRVRFRTRGSDVNHAYKLIL